MNTIQKLADVKLPDTEAVESLLLADMILIPGNIGLICDKIKPEQFSYYTEQFRYLIESYAKGQAISPAMMIAPFRSIWDRISPRLEETTGGTETDSHIAQFIDIRIRQQAYDVAFKTLQAVSNPRTPTQDILYLPELMNTAIQSVQLEQDGRAIKSIGECLREFGQLKAKEMSDAARGIKWQVSSGIRELDNVLGGGFNPGNLIIIAARPGRGKSALAEQFAIAAACECSGVLYASYEMTETDLVKRFLNYHGYYLDGFNNIDFANYNAITDRFANMPFLVCNDPTMKLDELCRRIRKEKRAGKIELAIIDYLTLIPEDSERQQARTYEIGKMTGALKRLAVKENVPIVLLAQLNRNKDQTEGIPKLCDLRDSGSIEQDADAVLMLGDADINQSVKSTTMYLRKNRHGLNERFFALSISNNFTRFECTGTGYIKT